MLLNDKLNTSERKESQKRVGNMYDLKGEALGLIWIKSYEKIYHSGVEFLSHLTGTTREIVHTRLTDSPYSVI